MTRGERRQGWKEPEDDDGAASPLGWQMKCCTRRRDRFHRNYKQGEGADGSCRNQDERREREHREGRREK